MRKLLAFFGLVAVVYALIVQQGAWHRSQASIAAEAQAGPLSQSCDDSALTAAFRDHLSRIEVCGRGTIAKVLKDDTQGSRHQRFIVRVDAGQTLLIAYNFDIAPRIEALRAGAPVEFVGEYEWNPQGGVVHWTHRDPGGRHPSGWIRYAGRMYE
jgi:hypothetical protein